MPLTKDQLLRLPPETEVGTEELAVLYGYKHGYVRDQLVKRPDHPKPTTLISQKNRRWRLGDALKFKAGEHQSLAAI